MRDERVSQPVVEQALRGLVPAGSWPPSTANPSFREICATLVQYTALGKLLPARPKLGQLAGQFV